ncbi:HupE/UreJ family protein [Microbacterium sp. B2969]|uniref:HupE/UreJ family protein n=1 Tax=Microbacterium alkaliflavum TaxID=3248839 RepID=A0ABW7Q2K9_9MICO
MPLARVVLALSALVAALTATTFLSAPALAHGFSSVVYVDASESGDDTVRTTIDLEYDLLVVSVAENEGAPTFFDDGMDAFDYGDETEQAAALQAHADEIVSYVTKRFAVSSAAATCEPEPSDDIALTSHDDVPYAAVTLDWRCEPAAAHEFRSTLFPDEESYVQGTITILEYDVDGRSGSASLTSDAPTFSTDQPVIERFGNFFVLGAEHLLFGIDHILFLLALIVGSRRLRDVVLAATAFTVAHSVTFIMAALGVVTVPAALVEPAIALSIAVVAIWYLWRVWRERKDPLAEVKRASKTGFDTADWARLLVVFLFGLMHGLGFASALGIDEPFSWPLLGSLLVFNVGIEAVQLTSILTIFPILMLLRRRTPKTGLLVGVLVASAVAVMGLIWFVQRVLGIG